MLDNDFMILASKRKDLCKVRDLKIEYESSLGTASYTKRGKLNDPVIFTRMLLTTVLTVFTLVI